MKILSGVLSKLFITLFLIFFATHAIAVNIGVQAPRGAIKAMAKWGELGLYLTDKVGQEVKIFPLTPSKTIDAVTSGEVDYMLSNPVLAFALMKKHESIGLVTLNKKTGTQFAGVIIASKDSGVTKPSELKGKTVMAFKFKKSAAAYVFQVKYMMDLGIDPHKDFASFIQAKKQDEIVLAVKNGLVDGGFIKSGLLENMAKEGKVTFDDVVILDPKTDTLKHVHTTLLYPEWTLTASKNADSATTTQLKEALLALKPSDNACKKANINGFATMVDFGRLDSTLKALKLPPY